MSIKCKSVYGAVGSYPQGEIKKGGEKLPVAVGLILLSYFFSSL